MARVFISYSREDAAKAGSLAQALEKAGYEVWWDRHIPSGSEYAGAIEEALTQADAVLVLWSKSSIGSQWVRDEAAEGRDSGRLVPVLLDNSRPPIGFRQIQAADLSDWSGRGRPKKFSEAVEAIRAKAGTPGRPKKPALATARRSKRRVAVLAAVLVVVAAVVAVAMQLRPPGTPTARQTLTLALLPAVTDSNDPATRQLAFAIRDSLAQTLSQSRFEVTQLESKPAPGKHLADFLMWVDVSRRPDKVIASVRMEEATRHIIVYSNKFEASEDRSWTLPDRIGPQVAGSLSWTVPLLLLDREHLSDPAVLSAIFKQRESDPRRRLPDQDLLTIRQFATQRELARTAPDSFIVQAVLAFDASYILGLLPPSERAAALATGRQAAARAHALKAEYGDPFFAWCVLHSKARMIECEDQVREGMRVDPDAPFGEWFLADVLKETGRFDAALRFAKQSHARDQYFPAKISHVLQMLDANGASAEADVLYRDVARWSPNVDDFMWSRVSGMVGRGNHDAIERFEKEVGRANWPPDYEPLSPVISAARTNFVTAVESACPKPGTSSLKSIFCMLSLANLGAMDDAFAYADQLYPRRLGRNEAEDDRLWLNKIAFNGTEYLTGPAAARMRRDPRYPALAERVGLLRYWRSGRLPDFCTSRREPLCSWIAQRRPNA